MQQGNLHFHCIACHTKLELTNAYVIGGPYKSVWDALKNTLWRCPECQLVEEDFDWRVSEIKH